MLADDHNWTVESLRSAIERQRCTISQLKSEVHVTKDAQRELDLMLKELALLMGQKVENARDGC